MTTQLVCADFFFSFETVSRFVGLAGLELTVANSQRDLPASASGVLKLKASMTGFLKITFQLFFLYGSFACIYVSATFVPGAWGG